MNKSIIALSILLTTPTSFAGPFGFELGDSLKKISTLVSIQNIENGIYKSKTAPKPHPDFDSYQLLISKTYGLCKIVAWSKSITNDAYGTDTIAKFKSLSEALNTKYGPSKSFDFLKHGSIWKERREWMMGLTKKERVLTAFWPENSGDLPDNIASINLSANGVNSDTAILSIGYESKNIHACLEELKSTNNESL